MIKWMLGLTLTGVAILSFEWPLPRTYFESVMILLGYILMLGPGYLLSAALLNRLVNISFTTDPERRHKK